ncbi:MAG: hypothetical protein HY769_09380 [Candidatus Stahlbacteria bacterium]|nr:hypothetical protein [Candidatus Stahlbacteria bacterium]
MKSWISLSLILAIFISIDLQAEFADKLFNEGRYSEATIEYERLNFFTPTPYFKYQIGMCYWKMGNLESAAIIFKDLDSLYQLTNVYVALGEYSLARFAVEDADKNLAGWIYMIEGRWAEAEQGFEKEELKKVAQEAKQLQYKSENMATILSVCLPGMGELYSKKWLNGSLTFMLTALAGVYAVKSFSTQDYVSGILISNFFLFRFYQGGIENAKRSAVEYNKSIKEQYLKKVMKEYNYPFAQ